MAPRDALKGISFKDDPLKAAYYQAGFRKQLINLYAASVGFQFHLSDGIARRYRQQVLESKHIPCKKYQYQKKPGLDKLNLVFFFINLKCDIDSNFTLKCGASSINKNLQIRVAFNPLSG
ncbi:hypothetical protein TNCV_4213671 [Trichonephila clavipes]|nr:hypothetical protein TNCV_4213671 [Trichonephila clavipes]